MIKATELRIGNLVTTKHPDNYKRVISLDNCIQVTGDSAWHTQVSAIPLSEEIILKCGFVADPFNGSFETFDNGLKLTIIDKCGACMIYLSGPFGMVVLKHIGSLHQLQNLYFALTGKELVYSA
jgi:hypothetical protein